MASKKKAAPKPKKKIASEDKTVAANLGVDVSEDAAPKAPVKVDRKKFRAVKEAKEIGGVLGKEDAAAVKEKRRYHATLATGALLSGVTGAEVLADRDASVAAAKAAEKAKSEEYLRSQPDLPETTGFDNLSQEEMDRRYSEQGKFPVPETSRPGFSGDFSEVLKGSGSGAAYVDIDELENQPTLTDEEREKRALAVHSRFEEVKNSAAASQSRRSETAKALRAHNEERRARGLAPVASVDEAAPGAAIRPFPKQEEPTYQQTLTEGTQEKRAAKLEKAKPIIAERTGKDVEDIGYAGDETYTDPDTGHTDSVNGHALRMAQRDYDIASQTGKEVNGIAATKKVTAIVNGKETLVDQPRPRPEKIEDIYDTAHRTMAYNVRHLGITEQQILTAPGQSRRSYEAKANALTPIAKQEANANRKIDISNEVTQGKHKGWEDENGVKHNFVFQKDGKVSPMSLPSDFRRTAGPISAIAKPSDSTESLMGAEQTPVDSEDNAAKKMAPNNAGEYIEGVVTSHEGWTEHDDGYFRNIKHPIPEDQRVSVARKVAGRIASMGVQAAEDKGKKKSSSASLLKQAGGLAKTPKDVPAYDPNATYDDIREGVSKDLENNTQAMGVGSGRGDTYANVAPISTPKGPNYDATGAADFDPETSINPRPPAISTRVLAANRGKNADMDDIRTAIKAGKITSDQASALNTGWDRANAIPAIGKALGPDGQPQKSRSDMTRSEKLADTKARRAAMAESKAKALVQPTRKEYQSKQFVGVQPVGKTESSAYLGAKSDVTNDRNYITRELGKIDPKTGKRMVREIGVHKGYEDLGNAAKKVEVEGSPVYKVMNDERGPVQEKEVISRMVQNTATKQGMPEKTDVTAAVKGGHISEEEGKELRNLDQFSQYRPQTPYGAVPQAKSMDDLKYSTVYSPVTTPAPRATHKSQFTELHAGLDDIKEAIRSKNISAAEGKDLWDSNPASAKPKPSRKKKAAAPAKVSEQLRSYIGSYQDIDPKELPQNRGRTGGAREGAGREFSNWQNTPDRIIKHDLKPGDLVSHQTHGLGKVTRIINPGEFIPGTEERSNAGRIKKNTGQKYTEHHVEIDFGKSPDGKSGGVQRLPLNENISENQRQAVEAAKPATVPGFGGDIKTRGRLGLKAGKQSIKAQPLMTKIEPGDK
jgi:hypothetical protein